MLAYLFLHLVNHVLGIWSLDLAGRGLLWRSLPGTIALMGPASLWRDNLDERRATIKLRMSRQK
ncbi:hypothetical protein M3I53_18680 [Paraburkholderia sp. CNPSo 3272]|uniref:hypothetical protein n=1 Tax=Paraburkholderia sp. CNPSo 3272 TaxID=2940931 RepID=UPI0020B6AC4C|nr:hypothetical protein [Paraburkholderia sp. CNPSo 3272]MCP3725128.1 hypothetical protein [Paraburkholderia sp. CNPSo 3272]